MTDNIAYPKTDEEGR